MLIKSMRMIERNQSLAFDRDIFRCSNYRIKGFRFNRYSWSSAVNVDFYDHYIVFVYTQIYVENQYEKRDIKNVTCF